MFQLVVDIDLSYIDSLYWKKQQQHAPCRILRMSVNRASTIFSFASWVMYVLIGYRDPFFRQWQPLLGKTTATCSLLYPANERQPSVNNIQLHILGNLCYDWLQRSIYQIMAACAGEKLQRHAPCHIARMRVNWASTVFCFASWVIYVLIGCWHPFMRYWQPLLAKTSVTCSLAHFENERQRRVSNFSCCIFGNQGIARIFAFLTELLTTLIGKNTRYQRWNTDSKLINISSCKACKDILLVVDNAILLRYC